MITPAWVDNIVNPVIQTGISTAQPHACGVLIGTTIYVLLQTSGTFSNVDTYASTNGGAAFTLENDVGSTDRAKDPQGIASGTTILIVGYSLAAPFFEFFVTPFDTTTNLYGAPVDAGFAVVPTGLNEQGFFCGLRPDGSLILAYQSNNGVFIGPNDGESVSFRVRVAGVWSAETNFTPKTGNCVFAGACLDCAGNLNVFYFKAVSIGATWDLVHVSISTANSVSAEHLIEPLVENSQRPRGNYSQAAFSNPQKEILFGYCYRGNSNFPAYGAMHAARGNTAVDPLNPTWTIDTVSVGNASTPDDTDLPVQQAAYGKVGIIISLTTIQAAPSTGYASVAPVTASLYWISRFPGLPNSASPKRLWRSVLTGAIWGAPELMYDASSQANTDVLQVNLLGLSDPCAASSPPPGGGGSFGLLSISPNDYDLCLWRDFNLYNCIDPQAFSCARKPLCFNVPESEWGEMLQ